MRVNSGVKSIAMGGRPTKAPMQALGGVKGAEVIAWKDIYSIAQYASSLGTPEQHAVLANLTALPIQRSTAAGINVRDNILRPNLGDGVPAHFVYEAADCRLFWTPPMVVDVTEIWKAVADAAFREHNCWGEKVQKRSSKTSRTPKPVSLEAPRRKQVEKIVAPERSSFWKARHGVKGPL
jgi:hypothetical protein